MDTPRKITPDNLKDAIVEFRFISEMPQEVWSGLVYVALKERFEPLPRTADSALWPVDIPKGLRLDVVEGLQFANEGVKIRLHQQNLSFNLSGQYPGWESYFPSIEWVIKKVFEAGHAQGVGRIGIRYISEFPSTSIFEHLSNPLRFSLPQGEGVNNIFKTELHHSDYSVVLNLADNILRPNTQEPQDCFSLVDVDVFNSFSPRLVSDEDVLMHTARLHAIEKEVFFGILNPQFVEQLQPEY